MKIKTFSIASDKVGSFSIYHKIDKKVVSEASKCDLYLIGGAAIEIWINHLNLRGNRNRSNNDLDFITYKYNPKYKRFKNYLLDNKFQLEESGFIDFYDLKEDGKTVVEVDVLLDADRNTFRKISKVKGINVMSPVFLFSSKFNRFVTLDKLNHKEKFTRDNLDLLDILKVINKLNMVDELENELVTWNFSKSAERKLNLLIASYNKLYS